MQSLRDALEMVTGGDRDSETSQKHRVGGIIRDTEKREVQTRGGAGELGAEEERAGVTQKTALESGRLTDRHSERAGAERRRPMMPPGGHPTPRPPRCIHADLSLTGVAHRWHRGWERQPSTPWSCGWHG
ncbi:unnamed protein product [Rangifer tarandus platyrhynchus]|uniref:Uncharacterized protein n=1 Tax=Rangifer tarandus platyrhynchus TaxID=3082113 RepID=A0AC59YTD5_RANTA